MTPDLLGLFVEEGRKWIAAEREAHRPSANALSDAAKGGFAPFYDSVLLENVRIKWVPKILNPSFFDRLGAIPLDFSQMAGITFSDTILLSQEHRTPDEQLAGLLFHELVHVAQYAVLGVDEFAKRYVLGWAANGFDYFAIPLEKMAYDLGARAAAAQGVSFSVSDEVKQRLAAETDT